MDHFEKNPSSENVDARRSLRRTFLLALIPGVFLAAEFANGADEVVADESGEAWTIAVQPKQPQQEVQVAALQADAVAALQAPAPEGAAPAPAEISEPVLEQHGIEIVPNAKFRVNGLTYRQVYDSIPFNRTTYLANPRIGMMRRWSS